MNELIPLNQRRSTLSFRLGLPAPSPEQLSLILKAALRVPDHGRMTPWRIMSISDDSRLVLSQFLADRAQTLNPDITETALEKERKRFTHAPVILTVIANPRPNPKVPEVEQILSAGCVCFALLQAAQALGFGAQWLTGWAAYDEAVKTRLGLHPHESITGFIHIGTPKEATPERERPSVDAHFSTWIP